jgi:sugar lactone lactonase YvrE
VPVAGIYSFDGLDVTRWMTASPLERPLWSPDGATFYVATLVQHDLCPTTTDVASGRVSNKRNLLRQPPTSKASLTGRRFDAAEGVVDVRPGRRELICYDPGTARIPRRIQTGLRWMTRHPVRRRCLDTIFLTTLSPPGRRDRPSSAGDGRLVRAQHGLAVGLAEPLMAFADPVGLGDVE